MLELPESVAPASWNPNAVDDQSDAELDALPFGVIALDHEGTILRYNLYESRFARLDRNQVLGRNFFSDVARCTRTETFEGRFRSFVASGKEGVAERFAFVFDFKFGAQDVSVEFVHPRATGRYYVLIDRRRVGAPRPDFPPELLATLQRELAPDEADRGVLRDELERRYVTAPATLFAALRATCTLLAPGTWELFATEWGVQWGRRAAVDLEASALESAQRSLRDLPMRDAAAAVARYYRDRGWASVSFDFAPAADGLLVAELDRSALAEAAPRVRSDGGPRSDLACHLVAGSLGALFSALAGRRLVGREVACVSGGAARCSIVVIAHERRATVDAVLGAGARGVEPVRAAMRRGTQRVRAS